VLYQRKPIIPGIVILAIVAIAVIILLTDGSGEGGGKKTGSTVVPTESESDAKLDRQDPNQSGCSPTAVTVRGSGTPVFAPNGTRAGELILRRSTACQTIWGEVTGLRGHSEYIVAIDVYRPSDKGQAPYHGLDEASPVFGNMLSASPGCVYATAYVQRQGRRGALAHTVCRT
jgi:hypothetical protein